MYHLLVSFQGWPEGSGTIPTERIYLRENKSPGDRFLTKGKLDIAKISTVPALLVTELGGVEPRTARIAYINGITSSPKDTTIHYATDGGFRPVPSASLLPYCTALGTSKNWLGHTHWEANDVDLFRVLLMLQQRNAIMPNVFSLSGLNERDPKLISVMMPFASHFDPVYAAIQAAATETKHKCARADDFWKNPAIIQDIVDLISSAQIVICDCTGRNPNVFYEAGIAHAIGKEVVLIAQSESDIPFDLQHLRYIRYLNNGEGLNKLAHDLKRRLESLTLL